MNARGERVTGPGRQAATARAQGLALLGVLASVALGAGGCGGTGALVARVGGSAITTSSLEHWTSVLEHEQQLGRRVARRRALAFLISGQWLVQEAAAQQAAVSKRALTRRVGELENERFRDGAAGLRYYLADTRQTSADITLRVQGELAVGALRRVIAARVPAPSQVRLLAYYRAHEAQFTTAERREIYIHNLPSRAAALAARRGLEAGRDFTAGALHEVLERPGGLPVAGESEARRRVFAARRGVLTGPVRVLGDYSLFEVTQVARATLAPFARVRATIAALLVAQERSQALLAFEAAWRRRWTARTQCVTGPEAALCVRYKRTEAQRAALAAMLPFS